MYADERATKAEAMMVSPEGAGDGSDGAIVDPIAVGIVRAALPNTQEAQGLAAVFGLLADPTRVRIVAALGTHELCVGDLARILGLRQSTLSHQLRLLRALRIVRFRKAGRTVFYALDDDHVATLLAQALAHERECAPRG
jgi:ArsR family transcriptional regulator